jgi:hypothetical protein
MGEVEEDTGEGGELRDEGIFSLSPTEEAAVEARETAAFSSGQRTPCSSLYWPRPELLGGGGFLMRQREIFVENNFRKFPTRANQSQAKTFKGVWWEGVGSQQFT